MRAPLFVGVGLAAGLVGYFVRDFASPAESGAQAEPVLCPSPPSPPPAPPEPCADVDACNDLAATLDHTDPAAALAAHARACNFGDAAACSRAAQMEKDPAQVLAIDEQGCELEVATACLDAGHAYLHGAGTVEDPERGWKLVQQACDHGSYHACVEMWDRYHDAHDSSAWGAALRLCDLGGVPAADDALDVGYACYYRAARFARAHNKQADVEYARAASHFAAACDNRDDDCYDYAAMLADGLGVRQDLVRARTLYRTACDAGAQDGCAELGEMLIRGEGGPHDAKRGRELRASACQAGIEDACGALPA